MSGRDSSRLGDTADTELERRRREQEAREATRSERREQVAEQLDLEPEQLERRQFDDRGEEIGFVPDDEGRDELRDQRADDDPFVEPGDLDVEADRRGTRVRIDEDRRDAVGERAAEDVASDDPFVEPEDLDPDVGERGVRDVTVREDRRDVVGERAAEDIASDDPFVEARDLDVDVGETGVQEARIAEDRRDAVGERAREDVAADGEFIEREDVTVEVGERGIEDIDVDEAAQRRSAVADIDDDTPVDIDRDDVERTDDGFTLRSDVQERVAVTEIDEDTPVDIGRDDVERTGDGFALRDDAQREVAAAEIDDEIDERDISPDDLERTDDGFALDDDVQQDLAADEIEDALLEDAREDVPEEVREFAAATGDPANIDPRGVREARDAFQAGEIDPRELQNVVAAFREDDPVPTADTLFNGGLEPGDIERTDDGFTPDDDVREDIAAREIDGELPEVDIDGDDVTIEETVTEETRVDPDTGEQDFMRDVETEARLTDAAQQRVAEQQLEDLAGDLESGDDVLIAPGVGVDDATGPTNLVLDFLRPVERGDLGAQADLGSVVDTGVNIPRSPTALVQQADPELAEDLLDIDADRVRDAQAELEAREELAEEDPQEIIEAIDDSPDRFVERAGIVERRLEMGQRQRAAARDAAEDLAAEFEGVDASDIDRDFSSRNVEVGLGDEAVDTVQRRAAADELGVDPDDVERTDDGFAVAEATRIEEAREELVDDIDDATLADIGEDDVAFDESDGQLEAELTDSAIERERETVRDALTDRAGAGVSPGFVAPETGFEVGGGETAVRDISDTTRAPVLEDAAGTQLDAMDAREAAVDEFRSEAAGEFGVPESSVDVEFRDGDIVATAEIDREDDEDFTVLAPGTDMPGDLDELLDTRPGEGDQVLETDLPTSTREAIPFVQEGSRTAATGLAAPAVITADIGERALDGLDIDTRDATAAAAGAVAVPEPVTSTAGAAVLAGAGAAAGLGAARQQAEIDVPDDADELEQAEISVPAERGLVDSEVSVPDRREDFATTELDVGTADTEVTEIETPDTPTGRTGEIGVPSIDAQQLIGREEFVDEDDVTTIGDDTTVISREDLEDTGPLVDIPAEEQQRQIREELERRQEFVREDIEPEIVDREPVRFPADEAATTTTEPVDEGLDVAEPSLATDVGSGRLGRDFPGAFDPDDTTAQTPLDLPERSALDLETDVVPDRTRDVTPRQVTPGTTADAIASGALDASPDAATGLDARTDTLADTELGVDTGAMTQAATALDMAPAQTQVSQQVEQTAETVNPVEDRFANITEPLTPQQPQPPITPGGRPPRIPLPDFGAGDDDADRFGVEADDDVFGTGILSGDEAFDELFGSRR